MTSSVKPSIQCLSFLLRLGVIDNLTSLNNNKKKTTYILALAFYHQYPWLQWIEFHQQWVSGLQSAAVVVAVTDDDRGERDNKQIIRTSKNTP